MTEEQIECRTKGPWHSRKTVSGMFEILDANRDPVLRIRGGMTPTASDARLIAAAPELLDAIEAILFQVCQGKVLERDACITQARAALAKAIA